MAALLVVVLKIVLHCSNAWRYSVRLYIPMGNTGILVKKSCPSCISYADFNVSFQETRFVAPCCDLLF